MSIQSVFAVIDKSTKAFVFLISAETKEQSEQTLHTHLNGNSEQFEIIESTLIFSDPVLQIRQLGDEPWKNIEPGLEC